MRQESPNRPSPGTTARIAAALSLPLLALLPVRALEVSEWKTRQSLAIDRDGLIKSQLPPATLDAARANLEDLRLLDSAGQETSFLLERAARIRPPVTRAPRNFRATLADSTTQILLETGTTAPLGAVTLVSPASDFLKAAGIEISADGRNWEPARTGAPVFRQFGTQQFRLDLEGRSAPHLRITIDDTRTRPVPFTGAILTLATSEQPEVTTPLPIRVLRREDFARESVLTLDLGAHHVPLAALEFATAEPLFARTVKLVVRELRDDTAVERTLATGTIYRIAAEGVPPASRLEIPLDLVAPSRELLVHIVNGDSPPLAVDVLRGRQRPIWLVFRTAAPGAYTLLTGNPQVEAPNYDLSPLAAALREMPAGNLTAGPVGPNPDYRRPATLAGTAILGAALDPAPWSYRKKVRLTTAGVQELELDIDVLARAQPGFADLRLVRDGAQVPFLLERPALTRAITLPFAPAGDPKRPRLSRWEITLPRIGLPLMRLTLSSPTTLFNRRIRLYEKIAADQRGAGERTLASMGWSHTPGNAHNLNLPLDATPAGATLLLETDNRDNPPIVLQTVTATYPVVRLLFRAGDGHLGEGESPAGGIALYYGNRQADAPRYDLALVGAQIVAAEKSAGTLGTEEIANAGGWATQAFAGLQGGPLFWGVLALVVVTLLVVIARLLPKPPASST